MVLEVKDATGGMTVTITEADRQAVQCSPKHCVIANAIRRRRDVADVRVGATTVRVLKKNGQTIRYELDQESIATVKAYDNDGQTMPAGFRVFLVPPRVPLGSRAGTSGKVKGTKLSNSTHVTNRKPTHRHILVDPPLD